jgi:hypothetical protein
MGTQLEILGGLRVAVCDADGPVLAREADINDFIGEVWGLEAEWLALPVSRLSPDFFVLKTGLAGATTQKFVNYRIGLAIIGDVSAAIAASDALRDYVREANAGRAIWFAPDMAVLQARLETLTS